jgi:hypothetical protein
LQQEIVLFPARLSNIYFKNTSANVKITGIGDKLVVICGLVLKILWFCAKTL